MPVSATYLKQLLTLTSLWMPANMAYNHVVDPFNAYHGVHRDGFNTIKISAKTVDEALTMMSHRNYFKRWIAEWVKGTWTPCPSG
jgi:hypothetical protein